MIDSLLAQELAKPYPSAVRVVGIKIRDRGEVKKFNAGEAVLAIGDRVLLDVAEELSYGVVYGAPQLMPFIPPMRVMQLIARKATSEDVAAIDRYERLASEGMKACREQAAALGLKMKLVEVFCSLHRRQMTFVYTAEDRIDFRDPHLRGERPQRLRGTLAHVTVAGHQRDLAGDHHVGRALDAVDQRLAAAVQVVELRFRHRVINVDGRNKQLALLHHFV